MSVILKDIENLFNPANVALLSSLEEAFSAIEGVVSSMGNPHAAIAMSALGQVAVSIIRGIVAIQAASASAIPAPVVAPSDPVPAAASGSSQSQS